MLFSKPRKPGGIRKIRTFLEAELGPLNDFEEQHLLADTAPPPDKLARHRRMIERLMFIGQVLSTVTAHPDFEDSETAAMIFATQQALRDSLRMFHHPMEKAKADRILQEVLGVNGSVTVGNQQKYIPCFWRRRLMSLNQGALRNGPRLCPSGTSSSAYFLPRHPI